MPEPTLAERLERIGKLLDDLADHEQRTESSWKSLHEEVARKATGMPQSECGLADLGPPYLGRCEELEPCSCEKLSFPHTRRCNRLLPCAGHSKAHSKAKGGE